MATGNAQIHPAYMNSIVNLQLEREDTSGNHAADSPATHEGKHS